MSEIAVFIRGEPKAQGRPRAFAVDGQARVYNPTTTEGWKSQVARAIEPFLGTSPILEPVAVELHFRFQRPKAHVGKKGLKRSAPPVHVGKPDLDNLAKAVMDAITTLKLWKEDNQVIDLHLSKRWCEPDERPGMHLRLTWLENAEHQRAATAEQVAIGVVRGGRIP